jgi:hypothetical protein
MEISSSIESVSTFGKLIKIERFKRITTYSFQAGRKDGMIPDLLKV